VRAPDGALHISGEKIEWDPPHKLSLTWNVNGGRPFELGATLVAYDIEPADDAACSDKSHVTPFGDDILSGGRQGLAGDAVERLLETGHPLALQTAPPQRILAALRQLGIAVQGGPAS
jgi:uncharacterized protein YndB with AHSA1/START domain